MCLAATYLVAWEYDRLKPIIFYNRNQRTASIRNQYIVIPLFFGIGGIVMAGLWRVIRLGNFPNYLNIAMVLALVGLIFGLVVSVHYRFMHVGELKRDSNTM
jgi:hypothetical protein